MTGKIGCYAEGREGQWEAFCLNFDLATQGASLEDARRDLETAIRMYLDYVNDLPADEQAPFLRRRAPASHWLEYILISLCGFARSRSKRRAESWAASGAHAAA